MVTRKKVTDPTNRVVCIFDERSQATQAQADLEAAGFDADDVRILDGKDDASRIDTTAKWFADTDEEMKRLERELAAGNTVMSVPIADAKCRKDVNELVKPHGARHVTHFGQWVTEVLP